MNRYTFPLWTLDNRVVGQPSKQLDIKYEATYSRVASALIDTGIVNLPSISTMGLFATNYDTINDYFDFKLKQENLSLPKVDISLIIERDKEVALKIRDKINKIDNQNYLVFNSKLDKLVKPSQFVELRNNFKNRFHFIDFDFMHNWGYEKEFSYLPDFIRTYSAEISIIHINAISYYPRTLALTRSRSQIEEILHRNILSKLTGEISGLSINSYKTCTRAPTEMTSVVFSLKGK